MIEKGNPIVTPVKRVDSSYVVKNDGTIEGSLTFVVDKANIHLLVAVDSDHPDDVRLKCYSRTITYGNNKLVTCVCSYIGIAAVGETKKTEPVISYDAGTNQEPIETHTRFDLVGGTPAVPKNGAQYDPVTKQFLGFSGADAGDLLGVQYYLTPSANFSMTYWTTEQPNLGRRVKWIKDPKIGVKMFPRVKSVKDFLLIDMPYRKVGDLYQVTEQYVGSGERGWNQDIYEKMPIG